MPQAIGIPKEIYTAEKRVAASPEVVAKLIGLGFSVVVESGAGDGASFFDDAFAAAGAKIGSGDEAWSADIVFKVRAPSTEEVAKLKEGATLISFIWPAQNPELMQALAARKTTVLAMDAVPRLLSRAQKMDALTSMAGITGYRAVIEAANAFGRYFNGQITAAGKVPPAKVFVAGAGVAGLAAIGTAAGLGAIVRANDTRAEVADQVKSLGGEFVKVDYEEEGSGGGGYAKVMSEGFQKAQREMYAKQAADVDIIITTALIPGKPAPKLITAEMVRSMKPGSVVVDLAAEQGGNCELTEPGQAVVKHGRHHHRLHRSAQPFGQTVLDALRQQSAAPDRGAVQGQGRSGRRQHGRRRDPRLHRDQGRRRHLAGPTAETPNSARRPAEARRRAGQAGGGEEGGADARDCADRGRGRAVRADRRLCADGLPRPLHRLRAGGVRRLHGGVERHAGAAHAVDERHQRDLLDHRDRRAAADRAPRPPPVASTC